MPAQPFKDKLESWSAKDSGEQEVVQTDGHMTFVSLHHHTTFSYLDGYGLPEEHVQRGARLGYRAMAVTEHGNVSSLARFNDACVEAGIIPIFGCELYTGSERAVEATAKNPLGLTQKKNHLTVLAGNLEGYRNLLGLISTAWADGFYYQATVTGPMLKRYQEGLIVLSGCTGSLLATSLIGGKNINKADASYARARSVAKAFKKMLGDRYYLEVQAFPELEETRKINPAYERLSRELGIPLVATADVHYPLPEQNEMQKILHNLRPGPKQTLEQQSQSFEYDIPLSHPQSDREVYRKLRRTGLSKAAAIEAVTNTAVIADRCDVALPKMEMLRFPLEPGDTTDAAFKRELRKGWEYRGFDSLPKSERKRYLDQVRYEMEIITEKDFVDYFLIVSDLVIFAKESGIPVGPARGSAAASLVCYLLRITEVNPMMFNHLVFERFIDRTREDLPDIDLDFDGEMRHLLWGYAASKYGEDRVGTIGTFTKFKSKNSLDDVARVFGVPQWEVDKVKEVLIDRSSGDLRASATIEDTIEMFDQAREVFDRYPDLHKAEALEGNYKGMGVHPAGIVVAPGPITDVCAIYRREVAGETRDAISYDKYDAEKMGLLKMDFLGLTTMKLIRIALEEIGMTLQELYELPLDIEEVYEGFRENDVIGIFQFDGRAMRMVNGSIRPDNFQEIGDVNALARPGPLHNGAANEYIDIKKGRKKPEVIHPLLEDITKGTNYQIVYQEQILRIVMEIGRFDWTHAAYIRKIISRRLGDQEFNRQGERFLKGAVETGMDKEMAQKVWGMLTTAGSYAFNAAHCVSYGMIAYWTMWLKRLHTPAFFRAALTCVSGADAKEKYALLLRDGASPPKGVTRKPIDIYPPDMRMSQVHWVRDGEGVRAGLAQIPGIGEKKASTIIAAREEHELERWEDITKIKGFGDKTVQKILEWVYKDDPLEVFKLQNQLDDARAELRKGIPYKRGFLPRPNLKAEDIPHDRGKDIEVVWVGKIIDRNLRDLFEVNMARTGVALKADEVKDPDKREWIIMLGQDETEQVTITVDRWRYPRFKKLVWSIKLDHDIVLVRGIKKGYQSMRRVYVKDIWVFDPEGE